MDRKSITLILIVLSSYFYGYYLNQEATSSLHPKTFVEKEPHAHRKAADPGIEKYDKNENMLTF